jgi:hypothetical protein
MSHPRRVSQGSPDTSSGPPLLAGLATRPQTGVMGDNLKSGSTGAQPKVWSSKALSVSAIIVANGSYSLSARAVAIDPQELKLVTEPSLRVGARVMVSFTLPIGGRSHLVRAPMTVLRVVEATKETAEVILDMQGWPSHQAALLDQFLST